MYPRRMFLTELDLSDGERLTLIDMLDVGTISDGEEVVEYVRMRRGLMENGKVRWNKKKPPVDAYSSR